MTDPAAAEPGGRTGRARRRLLTTLFFVASAGGVTWALWATYDRSRTEVVPGAGSLAAAGGLTVVALAAAARSWAALFPDAPDRRRLLGSFYQSQLAKYLPVGGIAQAAGQVGLAERGGIALRRAAVALPVHSLGLLAGAGLLTAGLAVADEPGGLWRFAALGGLIPLAIMLRRPWVARLFDTAHRRVARIPASSELPAQRPMLHTTGWAVAVFATHGLAFAVLVDDLVPAAGLPTATAAYAAAWGAGYLVLPLPSGLGVREAVLVGLLGTAAAPVLAASIAHRLVSIVAEIVVVGLNAATSRLAGTPAGSPTPPPERTTRAT